MDAARKSDRDFPGYTLAELGLMLVKHWEGSVILPANIKQRVEREIDARNSGKSKPFFTPQV